MVYAVFGFGTEIEVVSGGSIIPPDRVLAIPDGEFTMDFRGGFGTDAPSEALYRVVLTYDAGGTVTVESIGEVL